GVDAAFQARRNPTSFPDTSKWVAVLDGDEVADEGDRDGPTPMTTARRIVMTPEVQFRLIARSEDAGSELNALRAALIPAVLGDAELLRLTPGKSKIRYRGSATVVEAARRVDGAIGVGFAFHYL